MYQSATITKLVLLGDAGVGKSSIVRWLSGKEGLLHSQPTIGAAFMPVKDFNGTEYSVHLWDTAGQERFSSLAPIYVRGAHIILFVYDETNAYSLQNIFRTWVPLSESTNMNANVILVGNKTDLIQEDDAGLRSTMLKDIDCSMFDDHFHVSCLTGQGMEELKETISAYTLAHLQYKDSTTNCSDEDLIKLIKEAPPSKLRQCMGMGSGCKT
jgi:small GTP-binding protein